MKLVFKVGDLVFARVAGFEPFPATVENVLLNESDSSVFYYVRFNGGSKIVPIDSNNLLSFKDNKKSFKFKYNDNDLKKEAKLRIDALLGADDDIPEVLMNFVTVDSDFEEVSNETVKRLGLYSITLTSQMVKTLDLRLSRKHSQQYVMESESEDEFVDVEDMSKVGTRPVDDPLFVCLNCRATWHNKRALVAHLRSSKCRDGTFSKQEILEENRFTDNHYDHFSRKMLASRSASGYFNCKLCYRKFRSKGEAQAHMSSKHRSISKNIKRKVDEDSDASGSESESMSQIRDPDKHSTMERERRRALATKFEELSDALDLDKGCSKVRVLALAKQEIEQLQQEFKTKMELHQKLTNQNVELKARFSELNLNQFCS